MRKKLIIETWHGQEYALIHPYRWHESVPGWMKSRGGQWLGDGWRISRDQIEDMIQFYKSIFPGVEVERLRGRG